MSSYFGGIVVVAVVAGRALTVLKKEKTTGKLKRKRKKAADYFYSGDKANTLRVENEDSVGSSYNDERGIFAVTDGLGGHFFFVRTVRGNICGTGKF